MYRARIGIESLEKVSAWQARFDHHIHALTRPDHERVTRIESVGIRYRNRVHRDHVEPVTLQDHLQVVAVSGIEQPPPLHLAGLHMQGRAGDAVCRIGKSAWLAESFPIGFYRDGAIQSVCASEALVPWRRNERLTWNGKVRKGKRAKLLGFLMNKDNLSVVC